MTAAGGLAHRTILILCDAAETTGLGHFVRCMSLATVLASRDAEVRFLLPEDSAPRAVEQVRRAGWPAHLGPWLTDPASMMPTETGPAVIVDSYRLTGKSLTALHHRLADCGGSLSVIDDLADRVFEADLVLNQNVGGERLAYPGAEVVLAGPRFALLRPEFADHREFALHTIDELPDVPRRVLVLFGGTDTTGMAMTGARAAREAFPEAEVRAVVPGGAGAEPAYPGITVLGHVEAIHREMLDADLVLSAGGSTLWELCCLARPTAVVAVAGNQQPAYDEMAARDAILPVSRHPLHDVGALADRLRDLIRPAGVLRRVAANAAELTDGRGADRVAAALTAMTTSAPEISPEPP